MPNKVRNLVSHTWESEANLSLFLILVVLTVFVLPSVGFAREDERLYTNVCYTVILATGVANAWKSRSLFLISGAFAVIAIVLRWAAFFRPPHALGVWPDALSLVSIALIVFILLKQVFSVGPITSMRIQGAIAVYLGFGVAWAHAFHIANLLDPDSYNTAHVEITTVSAWIYYSFVTLTTVGYGDIVPVKPIARSLAIGEAVTGQLYLAVLLAHLVSMRISDADSRARKKTVSIGLEDS